MNEQDEQVTPEVTPEVDPVSGPEVTYIGEGAENVQFTVNPNALRYVVNANGMVSEDLK